MVVKRFDHKVTQHEGQNTIWLIADIPTVDNTLYFPIGGRCGCAERFNFDIQCQHGLKLSLFFVVLYYNKIWLNIITFNTVYPHIQPICTLSTSNDYNCLQETTVPSVIDPNNVEKILNKDDDEVCATT